MSLSLAPTTPPSGPSRIREDVPRAPIQSSSSSPPLAAGSPMEIRTPKTRSSFLDNDSPLPSPPSISKPAGAGAKVRFQASASSELDERYGEADKENRPQSRARSGSPISATQSSRSGGFTSQSNSSKHAPERSPRATTLAEALGAPARPSSTRNGLEHKMGFRSLSGTGAKVTTSANRFTQDQSPKAQGQEEIDAADSAKDQHRITAYGHKPLTSLSSALYRSREGTAEKDTDSPAAAAVDGVASRKRRLDDKAPPTQGRRSDEALYASAGESSRSGRQASQTACEEAEGERSSSPAQQSRESQARPFTYTTPSLAAGARSLRSVHTSTAARSTGRTLRRYGVGEARPTHVRPARVMLVQGADDTDGEDEEGTPGVGEKSTKPAEPEVQGPRMEQQSHRAQPAPELPSVDAPQTSSRTDAASPARLNPQEPAHCNGQPSLPQGQEGPRSGTSGTTACMGARRRRLQTESEPVSTQPRTLANGREGLNEPGPETQGTAGRAVAPSTSSSGPTANARWALRERRQGLTSARAGSNPPALSSRNAEGEAAHPSSESSARQPRQVSAQAAASRQAIIRPSRDTAGDARPQSKSGEESCQGGDRQVLPDGPVDDRIIDGETRNTRVEPPTGVRAVNKVSSESNAAEVTPARIAELEPEIEAEKQRLLELNGWDRYVHAALEEAQRQRHNGCQFAQHPVGKVLTSQKETKFRGAKFLKISRAGEGGFSTVFQVIGPVTVPTRDGGSEPVPAELQAHFAMKQVSLKKLEQSSRDELLQEAELLERLSQVPDSDKYVLKYFGHKHSGDTLKILMELGEMDFNTVLRTRHPLPRSALSEYWRQMLEAVHFVHSDGLVHSDLKPANFLMVKGRIKLIDFGIAQKIPLGTLHISRDVIVGTPNYMAPETIQKARRKGQGVYKAGKPSDVWSLGCILYQMIYGRTPFAHISGDKKLEVITDSRHTIAFPIKRKLEDRSGGAANGAAGGTDDDSADVEELDEILLDCAKSALVYGSQDRAKIPHLLDHPFVRDEVTLSRKKLKSIVSRIQSYMQQGRLTEDNVDEIADRLVTNLQLDSFLPFDPTGSGD